MAREIKFRAWELLPGQGYKMLYVGKDIHYRYPTAILMQFTGLQDRNGKDIYEDDFIEQEGHIGLICCEGWLELYVKQIKINPDGILFDDLTRDLYRIERFQIIGNIHENPELLGDSNG